jgi:hypothetical protein
MASKIEVQEEYDKYEAEYKISKGMIFIAATLLIIDYFVMGLLKDAQQYYQPWFSLVAAAFMVVLGIVCNSMPKPIFLLTIVLFFFFFGLWWLVYKAFLETFIRGQYKVMTTWFYVAIAFLKLFLFIFFYKQWINGYNSVTKLYELRKRLDNFN